MNEQGLEHILKTEDVRIDDKPTPRGAKVCLAISSFRNDKEIGEILRAVHAMPDKIFDGIIVVDSLGTGAIPLLIAESGWSDVVYRSYNRNLGSAGNLFERLQAAADTDADFVYALNHDGVIDADAVCRLTDCASRLDRIGAVYPLHYLPGRDQYDLTGKQKLPLPFLGNERLPATEYFDVHWGSSNGALYALAPFRCGLHPWADLWLGWEDAGYGWLLGRHGYRQVVVTGALFSDNYEYRQHELLGRKFYLPDKPFWYSYYNTRNMLLVALRNKQSIGHFLVLFVRLTLELGFIAAFKDRKMLRCKLLVRGVFDGLRNKGGKREYPRDPPAAAMPQLQPD